MLEEIVLEKTHILNISDFARERINYLLIHFCYFLCLISVMTFYFIIAEDQTFIDSFFSATSASTSTGLMTVDVSDFKIVSQVAILVAAIAGNGIVISLIPLIYRIFFIYRPKLNAPEVERRYAKLQIRACCWIIFAVSVYSVSLILIAFFIYLVFYLDPRYVAAIYHVRDYSDFWFSTFYVINGFLNSGFSLLPDSLISLDTFFTPLLIQMILILAGNTAFPIALRIIFAILRFGIFPKDLALELIWKKSRSVYTHLFNSYDTFKLVASLIFLNIAQWGLALSIDWDGPIYYGFTPFQKVYNAVFQSVSNRICGFTSLDLTQASLSVLILYIGCMYVSVFPIALSVRGSKVAGPVRHEFHAISDRKNPLSELRLMLFADLIVVFLGILAIAIFENAHLDHNRSDDYSFLRIVFEVVSAYGTVGLSLGFSDVPGVSFSYGMTTASKFLIIFLMLIGRHRGLPESDDPAITGALFEEYTGELDQF